MTRNRKSRIGLRPWLFVVTLFIACVSSSCAQQITGSIAGTVVDEQGAVVPNADVRATNVATGFMREGKTDNAGTYNIQSLPVGGYSVTVEAAGFKKFVQQNMVITVDQTQSLNVTLSVGAATQTVEVTTAPPLVNTSTAEIGRTVSPAEINGLPLTTVVPM